MINETVSTSGNLSTSITGTWNYLSSDLYNRVNDIINAPVNTTDMLWMLLPMVATLLLMEFYFGRYKEEDMGWNTAFGNSIVLLFVAIDSFRHLYEPSGQEVLEFISTASDIKIIVPLLILLLALVLMLVDFFHFLPKRYAYIMSSPAYINLLGIFGIITVYSTSIPLDWTTVFAFVIIFIIANLIMLGLYYVIPTYKPTISKIITIDDVELYDKESDKKKKKD
jgi:hypothetical protein